MSLNLNMKVDPIRFADFACDMYEAFVIQHDPRYPMCFHSVFAINKREIYLYLKLNLFHAF